MAEAPRATESAAEEAADEQTAHRLFETGRCLLADSGELVSLELRLAVEASLRMLGAAVAAAIVAAAAWLCLLAAAYLLALRSGWPAEWVLVGLAGVNLLACLALAAWVRRLCRYVTFPSTRRLLLGEASDARTTE